MNFLSKVHPAPRLLVLKMTLGFRLDSSRTSPPAGSNREGGGIPAQEKSLFFS